MSSTQGPNALQPGATSNVGSQLQLNVAGASIALGATTKGTDALSETEGHSVNLGATNVTTAKGFITAGGAETLSESITQLTVV